MNLAKRYLLIGGAYSLALIFLSMIVGYQLRVLLPPVSERLSLIRQALELVEQHYLGTLPPAIELERGMIRGMITQIGDPYTTYVEPAAHELQTDKLSGQYGGIGAFLSQNEEGMYVLIPFESGPAARVGIKEGDLLLEIDGEPIEPFASQQEVLAKIRGPVGSAVSLLLAGRSPDSDSIRVTIQREAFPIPSVTGYILPTDNRIGVIVISLFSEKTPEELEQTHAELLARGAVAMILDLRNNAGGLLDSAVSVAEFYLDEGLILIEHRKGDVEVLFEAETKGEAAGIPLVTLVNESTASSAEVVAAALQANGRSMLIGRKTFGKGSVQVILELKDGSSLYITSARWDTPNGDSLDKNGLEPDILIEDTGEPELDPYMAEAAATLQAVLDDRP